MIQKRIDVKCMFVHLFSFQRSVCADSCFAASRVLPKFARFDTIGLPLFSVNNFSNNFFNRSIRHRVYRTAPRLRLNLGRAARNILAILNFVSTPLRRKCYFSRFHRIKKFISKVFFLLFRLRHAQETRAHVRVYKEKTPQRDVLSFSFF